MFLPATLPSPRKASPREAIPDCGHQTTGPFDPRIGIILSPPPAVSPSTAAALQPLLLLLPQQLLPLLPLLPKLRLPSGLTSTQASTASISKGGAGSSSKKSSKGSSCRSKSGVGEVCWALRLQGVRATEGSKV